MVHVTYRVPSAKRICRLVVGALRSTSKLTGGVGLAGAAACAGAGAGGGLDDVTGAPPGIGLPNRFPEPANGPGGGGT